MTDDEVTVQHPLKQGLKRKKTVLLRENHCVTVQHPLKQGLKPPLAYALAVFNPGHSTTFIKKTNDKQKLHFK